MEDHSSVTLIGGKFRWDDPFLIDDQLTEEISGSETVMSPRVPAPAISPKRGITPASMKRRTIEHGTPSSPTTHTRCSGC